MWAWRHRVREWRTLTVGRGRGEQGLEDVELLSHLNDVVLLSEPRGDVLGKLGVVNAVDLPLRGATKPRRTVDGPHVLGVSCDGPEEESALAGGGDQVADLHAGEEVVEVVDLRGLGGVGRLGEVVLDDALKILP